MSEPRSVEFVSLDDVLAACRRLDLAVADVGLLDSAVARPQSSMYGQDAYPTLEEKAAALLQSLVKNHALVDGNKRIGFLMTDVFLRLNAHRSAAGEDALFDLVMDVAAGAVELAEIAARLSVVAVGGER